MTSSYSEALARKEKSASKKDKRAERVVENAALECSKQAPGAPPRRAKKKKSPTLSKLKKLLWEEMRHVVYVQSDVCLACGSGDKPVACHIVPSSDSAATKFFLPNVYRGCLSCNDSERRRRGQWVKRHEEIFGVDFVDALYDYSKTTFQLKKWWVLEQTKRMKDIRARAWTLDGRGVAESYSASDGEASSTSAIQTGA